MQKNLAVSIVIPLYNAEKYIGECLDSILNQTFRNFEVIIVDDCSTDSSPAIVESYREKFDGRLALYHMKKNSGCGALPRNKGIILSRGEYIFSMDNDDLIISTALEELYGLAKDYDADVVYCEKHYELDERLRSFQLVSWQKDNFINKPELESYSLSECIQRIKNGMFNGPPWRKLVKRDLMIENEIFFPDIIRDDDIWTWNLVFHSKRFLRVPNVVYIWRSVKDSITRVKRTPFQEINFWLNPVILGVKSLDKVMSKIKFFNENPQYHYEMLSFFIEISFSILDNDKFALPPFAVYETIKQKFGENLGEHDVLIPALCTMILNNQQKNSTANQEEVNQFVAQAQARIAELEKINRENAAYISELEKFIIESQKN